MTDTSPAGLAAIDLGSNSFHMIIARLQGDEPVTVDRLRDQVQLAKGLGDDRMLTPEAMERGIDCLKRFGQRLRTEGDVKVRVVGTNSLRVARNSADFRDRAEEVLGHPIEVISGMEEARLIYLGIAHVLADDSASRLVLDIGGGSTECIVGERFEVVATHSYYMGCVNYTQRFFPDGKITGRRMSEAVLAARLELQPSVREFRDSGWTEVAGASGTIRSIANVCRENGWGEGDITARGLRRFVKEVVAAGHVDKLSLPGLKSARGPIIAGGAAILTAAFESLGIPRMQIASGALQEGVLYDLMGRIKHEDVRERTIRTFQDRYHVDRAQAVRVERTARDLLESVSEGWELKRTSAERFLVWAARLHEIGLTVAYNHHHKHGAYLIANADMPGFSQDDQRLLSVLVACHRRRVRTEVLEHLDKLDRALAQKLIVLLRLAVLLNRGRSSSPTPHPRLEASSDRLLLRLPSDWLESHPLTGVDLAGEVSALRDLDLKLQVDSSPEDD